MAELNVPGAVGKVIVTANGPQSYEDAEPETLSYHRPVEEEAGTKTAVVMEGNEVAVIVAEGQGLLYVNVAEALVNHEVYPLNLALIVMV